MKNSNENIGNRTRDHLACSTALPPRVRRNENDRNEINKKVVGWI